ncbi:MAG: EAL domain-containing protein [Sedimenticola sp.]|nr:EAL domain-containing protein [Sedimenticola sp.]MCW8976361.1 EAL domain-containing protein [Sedimenticola sp.]
MNLQLGNRTVALSWHQQGLVSGALNGLYGREILTRARYIDNGETVTPNRLFPLLKSQPQQLLELTVRQIQTVMALDDQWNLDGSLWFNLAGELLEDDRLFEILLKTALYPLPPSLRQRVVLEVAEDALEGSLILERVETLRRYGFLIAMDDFGAGYSNLGRLQEGGFDIIKLDLGLIRGVPERIWAASFYREVVDLAASSGSLVVAEGVEHQTQSDFVRWAGVDIIQGFFYSRPQPLLAKRNGGLSLYGDIARSNEPDILLISS